MNNPTEILLVRVSVFLAVMLLVGLLMGVLLESAIIGFFFGLIAATFATGAATLSQKVDGSWTLVKRR